MLLTLGESRAPRPPLRVAGLTQTPETQISEAGRFRHPSGAYDNISVPSLLLASSSLFRRATVGADGARRRPGSAARSPCACRWADRSQVGRSGRYPVVPWSER